MRLLPVTLAALLFASTGFALAGENYSALAEEAVAALSQDFHEQWAYTETRLEDGTVWKGRYDPRKPKKQRWTLLSVDGHEPTPDETEDYLDEQDSPSASAGNNVRAMIEPDSLSLRGETDEYWLFEFVPTEDNEAFLRNVDSTLKIDKSGRHLSEIQLRSRQPFNSGFGVKLQNFFTRLTFAPVADGGPVVPRTIDVKVKGRAMLVVSFDEMTAVVYDDFEFTGD